MYGLLKSCACNSSKKERDLKRYAYCGTCKAIGSLYGQRSRFLLNNDATFLAELLLAKRVEPPEPPEMQGAFSSFNCMVMPSTLDIPIELQISSSVNLLLAEFKFLDRLADAHGIVSEFAYRAFSDGFSAAASRLVALRFPVQEAFSWLKEQEQREKSVEGAGEPLISLDTHQRLRYFAEATVKVTSSFFRQAAIVCGFDFEAENFAELGSQFGSLIYLLDALEDYESDFARRDFNAIRSAYELEGALPADITKEIVDGILMYCDKIVVQLESLHLPQSSRDLFQQRFRSNTRKRISKFTAHKNLPHTCRRAIKNESSSVELSGVQLAKEFSGKIIDPLRGGGVFAKLFAPLAGVYAFIFALLCPAATKDAGSIKDCLEMPFNLIFLSYFASRLSNPRALILVPAGASPGHGNLAGDNGFGAVEGDGVFFNVGNSGRRKKKDSEEGEGAGPGPNGNCPDCDCGSCDCCDSNCCDSSCFDCCGGGHHGGACCGDVQCCDCGTGDCGACDCGSADCGSCDCNCSH